MTDNYAELRNQVKTKMAELKLELQKLGESFFKEGSANVFKEFPEIKSFSWTQYTPYWNDGEPCNFRVNDWFEVTLKNGEVWEDVCAPYRGATNREEELGEILSSFITAIDEDIMLALFDDHARVTVYNNGQIEVEEYEHE